MEHGRETHFATETGVLCGAEPPYEWSQSEAQTSCRACRFLLEAGEVERLRARRLAISRFARLFKTG
jgi:hypothetical protein